MLSITLLTVTPWRKRPAISVRNSADKRRCPMSIVWPTWCWQYSTVTALVWLSIVVAMNAQHVQPNLHTPAMSTVLLATTTRTMWYSTVYIIFLCTKWVAEKRAITIYIIVPCMWWVARKSAGYLSWWTVKHLTTFTMDTTSQLDVREHNRHWQILTWNFQEIALDQHLQSLTKLIVWSQLEQMVNS